MPRYTITLGNSNGTEGMPQVLVPATDSPRIAIGPDHQDVLYGYGYGQVGAVVTVEAANEREALYRTEELLSYGTGLCYRDDEVEVVFRVDPAAFSVALVEIEDE